MKTLTTRTRIELRWSTAARHVGYAAQHETNDLAEQAVDFTGTPRQIVAELERVRRNVGQGTFLATIITTKKTGETIDASDLRMLLEGY